MRRFALRLLPVLLILALLSSCINASAPGLQEPYEPIVKPDNTNTQTPPDDTAPPVEGPDKTPEDPPQPPPPEKDPYTVATMAVCGDVMSHMPVTNAAKQADGTYDYSAIMAAAEPYVSAADFSVANLETTLAAGNYSGYPSFRSPDALAYDLKEMGFDLLLTANNHCVDASYEGLFRTLDVLDEVGLLHVGTSRDTEEQKVIPVADVGGISVAFLGYTYGTNGIPVTGKPYSVNIFNDDYLGACSKLKTDEMLSDIERAKELDADLICVMIHWGVEYQTKQNSYQNKIADFLIKNGVDLVLGGHSHVPQPMELRTVTDDAGVERTGFVCFSLGNFMSNQNATRVGPHTDVTAVLTLELTRDNETGDTSVTDWSYVPLFMQNMSGYTMQLMDCYQGTSDKAIQKHLDDAIADCRSIFGPDHYAFKDAA